MVWVVILRSEVIKIARGSILTPSIILMTTNNIKFVCPSKKIKKIVCKYPNAYFESKQVMTNKVAL